MPINKGLGGFCFLKSVKDEIIARKKWKTKKLFFKKLKKGKFKKTENFSKQILYNWYTNFENLLKNLYKIYQISHLQA